jgi:hypothetical protein
MQKLLRRPHVIAREDNVVRVDFSREPDPPAPRFPGAAALRAGPDRQPADPSWDVLACGCLAG